MQNQVRSKEGRYFGQGGTARVEQNQTTFDRFWSLSLENGLVHRTHFSTMMIKMARAHKYGSHNGHEKSAIVVKLGF